jgi:hypothetical protein
VVRTLSQLYNIPLIGVNHCVGRKSSLHQPSISADYQILKWADISPHPTTQSYCTFLVETHRSSPTRSSAIVYLGRPSTLQSETVWIDLPESFLCVMTQVQATTSNRKLGSECPFFQSPPSPLTEQGQKAGVATIRDERNGRYPRRSFERCRDVYKGQEIPNMGYSQTG